MDKKTQKHILSEVFDNRFRSSRLDFVAPFITTEAQETDELPKLKENLLNSIISQDATFEAMTEAAIFTAESVAMKSFMEYVKYLVEDWNAQNKNGKHFFIEISANLKEYNG